MILSASVAIWILCNEYDARHHRFCSFVSFIYLQVRHFCASHAFSQLWNLVIEHNFSQFYFQLCLNICCQRELLRTLEVDPLENCSTKIRVFTRVIQNPTSASIEAAGNAARTLNMLQPLCTVISYSYTLVNKTIPS